MNAVPGVGLTAAVATASIAVQSMDGVPMWVKVAGQFVGLGITLGMLYAALRSRSNSTDKATKEITASVQELQKDLAVDREAAGKLRDTVMEIRTLVLGVPTVDGAVQRIGALELRLQSLEIALALMKK